MALSFSPATYADEECTEVSINLDNDNSELQEKIKAFSSKGVLTALDDKPYFQSRLDEVIILAVRQGGNGCVFYINRDNFSQFTSEFGVGSADTILCAVAN